MKVDAAGIRLIGSSEGCKLEAYKCPAGVWTIGFGHTSRQGPPMVHPGQRITQQEAVAILRRDLDEVEETISRLVKPKLEQHQYNALASFILNVGAPAFKSSTLLRKVNSKDFKDVPTQLLRWTHGGRKVLPGLVARRHAEVAMWLGVPIEIQEPHEVARKVGQAPAPSAASYAVPGSLVMGLGAACSKLADSAPVKALLSAIHDIPTAAYVVVIGALIALSAAFMLGAAWTDRKEKHS